MDQQILDKIASLINLKENPGTPGEAAAAAAALQRLLFKHNLAEEDVRLHATSTKQVAEEYIHEMYDVGQKQGDTNGNWKHQLLFVICKNNFCGYVSGHQSRRGHIVGQKHNVVVVKAMFEYLVKEIKRLTIKEWRAAFPDTYGQLNNTKVEFSWKRSFREGAVAVIAQRLAAERREDLKEAGEKGAALVVQKDKELKDAITKHIGETKAGRSGGGSVLAGAYSAGKEAGRNINLNKQVGGGSSVSGNLQLGKGK